MNMSGKNNCPQPTRLTTSNHCVVVPVYEDYDGLLGLLNQNIGYNIIAVIDGKNAQKSIDLANAHGCCVNARVGKRGYGRAIIDGLEMAADNGYEYATVMDLDTCDVQYMQDTTRGDILCRNRKIKTINPRVLLSIIAALLTSIALGKFIKDATHGYRTYRLEHVIPILKKVRTNGHATNMEILCLSILNNLHICWTQVPYILTGKSELRLADMKESIKCLLTIYGYQLLMLL